MNTLRVPLIRNALTKFTDITSLQHGHILKGFRIMDVGCGGGILAEPLARLGADVTGVDASPQNIDMAEWHAKQDKQLEGNLRYVCRPVEQLAEEDPESYDAVVASEVIEHVADPSAFVAACCTLVKPGGSIIFTTINKTAQSYALAIVAAEQVIRVVAPGTHDWNKFISPDQLEGLLQQNNCQLRLLHGMRPNILTMSWNWTNNTSVNYALHAIKEEDKKEEDIPAEEVFAL